MRLTSMRVLGVVVPTLAALAFEGLLLAWEGRGLRLEVLLGRTGAMALGAAAFSWFMVGLFEKSHRAVLAERRRLEALFQGASEAILLVDPERRVQAMNRAARQMLRVPRLTPGFQLCQLCPQTPNRSHPPGQCAKGTCNFDLSAPNPFFETSVRLADGGSLPVVVSTSLLPGAEGREARAMVCLRDNSERRALEKARLAHLIAARTMEAQEEERRRIAQELHDGIGQELYGLRLCAQVGQPVEAQIVALMEEVQRLATDLYPAVLEKLGLVAALRSQASRLYSDRVVVEAHGEIPRLSRAAEAALFRLVQEAVRNAFRHGRAARIVVAFRHGASEVHVEVRDDGCGFVPEEVTGGGLGLVSMQERVESLGGRFSLESTPGEGACVRASLHDTAGRHPEGASGASVLVLPPGPVPPLHASTAVNHASPDRG